MYNTANSHIIRISPLFREYFAEMKFARLLYEDGGKRFAIKPFRNKGRDTFLIRRDRHSKALDIYPMAFLIRLRIPHGRHPASWDKSASMLVVRTKSMDESYS